MKKRTFIIAGIMTALLLTGCQSNTNNAETEALKQQIAQLEQQVTALEQQGTEETLTDAAANDAATGTGEQGAENNNDQEQAATASGQTTTATTHTMEELTEMVDAFVEKAGAASPTGTESENLEQFFSLKQEENQIDDSLDLHEDELEAQYRQGALTREDYKALERELDKLEDKLDLAEDRLELTFGIKD